MKKLKFSQVKELVSILATLISLSLVYCFFFSPIRIDITTHNPSYSSDERDLIHLFHARRGKPYSPNRSQLKEILQKHNFFQFEFNRKFIDTLYWGRKIRIDPTVHPDEIIIKNIIVRQKGYRPVIIDGRNEFKLIKPLNDVDAIERTVDGLSVKAAGEDLQLEMVIGPGRVHIDFRFLIILLVSVTFVGSVLYLLVSLIPQKTPFIFAPIFLVFLSILILYTSSITQLIHLDELVHVQAGMYYEKKWIPPEICSPEIIESYSISGISRLDNLEIVYLFAGKVAKVFTYFNVDMFQRYRYFNVLLFLILALLSLKYYEYRILTLPLLITPQVWYLFTYFNSDAFSLFVIIVISYQVIAEKSMTNLYLANLPNTKFNPYRPLVIGLLFSLLLMIKVNYYIFIIFLLLVLVQKLWLKEYLYPKVVIKRVAVIVLVAAAAFGIRWGIDVGVNGMDRKEKRVECRIKLSDPLYSPATPLEERFKFKNLKDRNVLVSDLFKKYNWGWKTFIHSFGVYYTQPRAMLDYYKIIMVILLFGSVYMIFSNLKQFQIGQVSLMVIVGICSALLVFLSLWNSWAANFQAQGRYLFPILVMVGVLIYETLPNYNEKLINLLVLVLFGLSTYSYVVIGLMQFPKL